MTDLDTAKAVGKFAQPFWNALLDDRQALPVPGLVGLQEPGDFAIKSGAPIVTRQGSAKSEHFG